MRGQVVIEAAGTIARNPLRSSLAALAVAAAVATTAVVQTGLDALARTARETSAKAFGADTFVIARLASGNLSRRELADKLARNPAIARNDVRYIQNIADGRVAYAATAQKNADVALGDELNLSGKEILTAWVVGYEIGTRLSANIHTDRDWHPTAIYGTMGATAAASKLLKLDVQSTRMALGIAGSEAGGLRRNFGTMTKPFHPGQVARNGIIAAKLAAKGFTADPDIIEGRQGYADNFGGAKCNIPMVTKFLGKVYYLEEEGTRIKPWPCCGGNHQMLTGLLAFLKDKKPKPEDIESVEHIGPNIPCTGALLRSEVTQGLEGKFTMAYNISAAIIDGKVDYNTFTDKRAAKGDLQAFMARVKISRNNDVVLRRPHIADGNHEARLVIKMRDGRVHNLVLGTAHHLTGDEVLDKFRLNAEATLGRERTALTISLVQRLEKMKDVAELMDAVTMDGKKASNGKTAGTKDKALA